MGGLVNHGLSGNWPELPQRLIQQRCPASCIHAFRGHGRGFLLC